MCACAASKVISSASNTYAKKSKRLGIRKLPIGRLQMVIFTYSNILLSVSMMDMTHIGVSVCGHERSLRLFEVLARNRQAPWNEEAVQVAHTNNQTECVQYLLDNNCPLPYGWSYKDGELQTVPDHSESSIIRLL